jgi:electron transfer flavoprotein alpha subunit
VKKERIMANESGILVLIHGADGRLTSVSAEMLGAARRVAGGLGGGVTAVAFGTGAADYGRQAIAHGADAAVAVEDANLDEYRNETWTAALTAVAREVNPAVVLIGQTATGRDLAPRFAVRIGSAAAMDCVDFEVRDGALVMTRPCYGGNAMAKYKSKTLPAVATVRPKSQEPLEADVSRTGEVRTVTVDAGAVVSQVVNREQVQSEGMRLEDAKVIVSGGRGLGSAEAFAELETLAKTLGGAVGASRAAVDLGWIPLTSQIGLTGKVVTPDLYIAVAISGASQHLAGITGARNVVAINKDPEADIFKHSRFGVVADWKTFIPAFTEEVRKLG